MVLPLGKTDCLVIREPYEAATKTGRACRTVKYER